MKYRLSRLSILTVFAGSIFLSCQDAPHPKPDALLSLEYPKATYEAFRSDCHFEFDKNQWANIQAKPSCSFEIHYPAMKATVFINYKPVDNNLTALLQDAQKLTYEHFIKADEISSQPYINAKDKVYGMFYSVEGDAATNAQFYATDSVKNFMVASLYFYAKPNYDSILPATEYIKKDMYRIMESIQWQD
ncbi:gliding motility lipoprotein GldD [Flavobacterium sp. JP2137]|uniref:gliding motility lipoprotein GldD n=1 Tax=Flavobacterium sp. JP2137 TaxID=3414510 RepID=UPI003D2FE3A3